MSNLSKFVTSSALVFLLALAPPASVQAQDVIDLLLGTQSEANGERKNKVGINLNIDLNSLFKKKQPPKPETTPQPAEQPATPKKPLGKRKAAPVAQKRIIIEQSPRPFVRPNWMANEAALCLIDCANEQAAPIDFDTLPRDPDGIIKITQAPQDILKRDRFFVRISPDIDVSQGIPLDLVPNGMMIIQELGGSLNALILRGSDENAQSLITDPRVLGISQDFEVTFVSNSPVLAQLTQNPDASHQDLSLETSDIRVYVVDSGLREMHLELAQRITHWIGLGTPLGGAFEDLCNYHGTMMGSLIAGQQLGLAERAQLVDVNVMPCDALGKGRIFATDILTALSAIEQDQTRIGLRAKPFVVNMSLATHAEWAQRNETKLFGTTAMVQAVDDFIDQTGAIIVAAAGNDTRDACLYFPALIKRVITVGALDTNGQRAEFSNFGACVDVYAPGVDIPVAGSQVDTKYLLASGTSQAAAIVTGVIAHRLAVGEPANNLIARLLQNQISPDDTYLVAALGNDTPPLEPQPHKIITLSPTVLCQVSSFGASLNLRREPNILSTIITGLDAGTPLTVVGYQENWLQVRTTDLKNGWVAAKSENNILVNQLGTDAPCFMDE